MIDASFTVPEQYATFWVAANLDETPSLSGFSESDLKHVHQGLMFCRNPGNAVSPCPIYLNNCECLFIPWFQPKQNGLVGYLIVVTVKSNSFQAMLVNSRRACHGTVGERRARCFWGMKVGRNLPPSQSTGRDLFQSFGRGALARFISPLIGPEGS